MNETTPSALSALRRGARDGIPIGLGYFAVAFALGLKAREAGLDWVQSFLASILCNASAGEKAGIDVIAGQASLWMMVLMSVIVNARYLLMSTAMSQRMDPKGRPIHRFAMSMYITDELFAITIAQPGYLQPFYLYGAAAVASPCWAVGTALGCVVGDLMPPSAVSALSVALYGMFLAAIIPPCRKDRGMAVLVALCFAASYASGFIMERLPALSGLDPNVQGSIRIIALTVVITTLAALLAPHEETAEGGDAP